jgi:hypothetical protein
LLALIALLLLASLTSLVTPDRAPVSAEASSSAEDGNDALLYESIVDDMRHGADYYSAAAGALRMGGYPLRPFTAFRLPTLAVVQSGMSPVAAALLLYALAIVTLWSWWVRLRDAFRRLQPRLLAILLAAAGVASAVSGELVACHEIWAGLLIALSLAARRPWRWGTAVALGLSAMLIHETAVLYVIVMAGAALIEDHRREASAWIGAIAVFAIVLLLHVNAVAQVLRPLDPASPGWTGVPGFGFAVRATVTTSAISLLPAAIGALLAGLALAGWAAWRDPLAMRAFATLVGDLLLLSLFGRPGTSSWAFLIAPFAFVGLAFTRDAARDLFRAALDRRRITVTRTAA